MSSRYSIIVDDDPTLRSALAEFLKRCGYMVQSAKDGRAAIRMLEQLQCTVGHHLDNFSCSEFDGFELIMHLRKSRSQPGRLLAMTGDGLSDLSFFMKVVRQLGVKHTLTKPFSLAELAGVVRTGDWRGALISIYWRLIYKGRARYLSPNAPEGR